MLTGWANEVVIRGHSERNTKYHQKRRKVNKKVETAPKNSTCGCAYRSARNGPCFQLPLSCVSLYCSGQGTVLKVLGLQYWHGEWASFGNVTIAVRLQRHFPPTARMARLYLQLLLAFLLPLISALKFDIVAHPGHESKSKERCVRNFVAKDQLVVVTATVSGNRGDGQVLNMHIKDAMGNDYHRPRDVVGESRSVFTSHADSSFDVCFENIQSGAYHSQSPPSRFVELDIDIGADAKDWGAIQAGEKLRPVEAELKRLYESAREVVEEMDYLRTREIKLRDTNESTNERVKWFSIGTMGMLVALGVWQVVYLRAYFRSKHLI
nr:endoplasmic reticulum vesicle protein 25 [Quercus suber]